MVIVTRPLTLGHPFKRRTVGPVSASPAEILILCVLVVAAWKIADGVFRDKAVQRDLYAAISYARPLAEQLRWDYEQTGRWPTSLRELNFGESVKPRQIARLELLRKQGVRIVFAIPAAIAGKSLVIRVTQRGPEHILECRTEDIPQGPLPSLCRPGAAVERLAWPPEIPGNPQLPPR